MSSSTTDGTARLAVLISGAGSNMLAIAHACAEGHIPARISVVIADVPEAGGLARARALGLNTLVVDRRAHQRDGLPDRTAFEAALDAAIRDHGAESID